MSPMILQQTLYEISDDQRMEVEKMGLGSFIGMTLDDIPSRLGYFVVNKLDTNNMELRLNHGTIIINEETVHQILKVPIGGIDLATVEPDSQSEVLASTWKKQYAKEKMRPTDVMKRILESSDDGVEFKLNFLALFVNSMAECCGMGCCTLNFLHRIKNTYMIPRVNWSRYISECLKRSKNRWRNDTYDNFYAGPLTFLMLLYVESTVCDIKDLPNGVPPLRRWTDGVCIICDKGNTLIMMELNDKFALLMHTKVDAKTLIERAKEIFPDETLFEREDNPTKDGAQTPPVQEGGRMCTPRRLNFNNVDSLEAQSPLSPYWYSQTTFGLIDVQIIEQSSGAQEKGGQPSDNVKEADFPIVSYVEEDVEPITTIPGIPNIPVPSFNLGISQPVDSPNASAKGKAHIISADEQCKPVRWELKIGDQMKSPYVK
ncbi:hypothetical protein L6452_05517 [Arctium lappa]|uniref:Uncharacterized protein n=1 Tax=Arctium lappa TaxID=4217 RepID=A0ACB9EGX7_ARCLA|nr:hypothetical protein L6452_05517 [Arctium lappa]